MVYENTYQHIWNSTFRGDIPPLSYNALNGLALEIMKEYAIWLGMTQIITSQREINNWTRNMNFNQKCDERLVFKPFLITMIQNINVWTHLALVGNS